MTDPHAELAAVAAFCDAPLSSREVAKELDRRDPLKHLHSEFRRPPPLSNGTPSAYLCGANIGLPHRDVASELVKYVSKWGDHGAECLIRDPDPYFYHDEILHDELAHIVGAKRNEVVLMNGLTVNMHFLFAAFYKPQGKRTKVLCEKGPFPSDKHALVSQLESRGLDVKEHLVEIALPGQNDPHVIPTEAILAAIEAHKDTAAILWLPAMQFLTGQFFEVGPITAAARKHGILVGVDAAHAVGNVPLHFHDWGVDFAVWCSYKYLSSGPGGIGGAFVHERHLNRPDGGGLPAIRTCYKGWWGNDRATRFDVRDQFDYAPGAMALPTSNPSIASIIGLIPSVKLIGAAGMPALRAKSALLTTYLDQLVDRYFAGVSVDIVSPRDWRQRGAQLTLRVRPDGLRDEVAKQYDGNCVAGKVKAHVMKRNVYIDYRKPDILRISPAATFSSFVEVHACVEALRETLRARDAPEKRSSKL